MHHLRKDGLGPGLAALEAAEIDRGRHVRTLDERADPVATKSEALSTCSGQGLSTRTEITDTKIVDDLHGECKAHATLTAQLAMRGYCLSALSDGSFLIHRWNLSKPIADLRAAAAFLRQITGAGRA